MQSMNVTGITRCSYVKRKREYEYILNSNEDMMHINKDILHINEHVLHLFLQHSLDVFFYVHTYIYTYIYMYIYIHTYTCMYICIWVQGEEEAQSARQRGSV